MDYWDILILRLHIENAEEQYYCIVRLELKILYPDFCGLENLEQLTKC